MRARTVFRSYKEIRGGRSFQDIYCSFFRNILSPSPLTWPGARVVPLEITAPTIPQGRTEIRKAIPLQDAIVLDKTSGYYCNYEGREEGGGAYWLHQNLLAHSQTVHNLQGLVYFAPLAAMASGSQTSRFLGRTHCLRGSRRDNIALGVIVGDVTSWQRPTANSYVPVGLPYIQISIAQHTLLLTRTSREYTVLYFYRSSICNDDHILFSYFPLLEFFWTACPNPTT